VTDYRLCKADEFRCDSGQCIPLEYKCKKYREEQMGCVDKSHLRNCGMLNVNIYIYCHVYPSCMFQNDVTTAKYILD